MSAQQTNNNWWVKPVVYLVVFIIAAVVLYFFIKFLYNQSAGSSNTSTSGLSAGKKGLLGVAPESSPNVFQADLPPDDTDPGALMYGTRQVGGSPS